MERRIQEVAGSLRHIFEPARFLVTRRIFFPQKHHNTRTLQYLHSKVSSLSTGKGLPKNCAQSHFALKTPIQSSHFVSPT